MAAPFLGKPELYWCSSCDLPLLQGKCSCGAAGHAVPISPPGEVRPMFAADRARMLEAAKKRVGDCSLPDLVLLNKLGDMDRMDEVIAGGEVIGVFRYDIERSCFDFSPRTSFCKFVSAPKRVFIPQDVVKFLEHGDLLAPGVSSCDAGISPGDWVFVLSDRPVACGLAMMDSGRMAAREKGMAVKIKDFSLSYSPSSKPGRSLSEAVSSNVPVLERMELEAVLRMKEFAGSHKKPVSVSFSGGKDSLAVLLLAERSGLEFSVIFADTGIEFPETLEVIERTKKKFRVLTESAGNSFFYNLDFFGPPARDFRWCCKSCKLGPLARLILRNFPDGCVTFGGERRFESESRMRRGFEGSNPWVGNQLSFYPLYNWNSLSVWFYLLWKKAAYNPLYELGYERIGCYLCPASSMAEIHMLRESHAELYGKLASFLEVYIRKNALPEGFVKYGLWRWKRLNPAMERFAKEHGISLVPVAPPGRLSFRMVSGVSPCKSGGYSIECTFSRPICLGRAAGFCRILGEVKHSDSLGILVLKRGELEATLHSTGTARIRGPSQEPAPLHAFARLLEDVMTRSEECVGCGVCAASCPSRSIDVSGGKAVVRASCTACGSCLGFCPVVRFK